MDVITYPCVNLNWRFVTGTATIVRLFEWQWIYNLTRYVKLRVAQALGMSGPFSPPPRVSDPDMHHGTCATHVPWCMPGSLTSALIWSRWRGKRSRHSRRMRSPNFTYLVRGPWGPRALTLWGPQSPWVDTGQPTQPTFPFFPHVHKPQPTFSGRIHFSPI